MLTATAEPAKEMKEQELLWDKAADKNLCYQTTAVSVC